MIERLVDVEFTECLNVKLPPVLVVYVRARTWVKNRYNRSRSGRNLDSIAFQASADIRELLLNLTESSGIQSRYTHTM